MNPCPQPLEGFTHPPFSPEPPLPSALSARGPPPPPPASPPSEVPEFSASPVPGPLSALTGLALLPPGAGWRRGRCGAATSLQLVRWGRRRGGHGVGDRGQRRRGTDAPWGCTMARKGRQGRRRPPRGSKPEVRRGGGGEPGRQLHACPASPPARGRSHRNRNSAWQPPLRAARRGSEARSHPPPSAGRAGRYQGTTLGRGPSQARERRVPAHLGRRRPWALLLGRTIPRRGAAAEVREGVSARPGSPSGLGFGRLRSHPAAAAPAANTNISLDDGPALSTPQRPPGAPPP